MATSDTSYLHLPSSPALPMAKVEMKVRELIAYSKTAVTVLLPHPPPTPPHEHSEHVHETCLISGPLPQHVISCTHTQYM